MTHQRQIVMDAEQAAILEEIGEQLIRDHDERATKVLALTLAYRYAAPVFACDIDESAGLADNVYPLIRHAGDDWSQKVGS